MTEVQNLLLQNRNCTVVIWLNAHICHESITAVFEKNIINKSNKNRVGPLKGDEPELDNHRQVIKNKTDTSSLAQQNMNPVHKY